MTDDSSHTFPSETAPFDRDPIVVSEVPRYKPSRFNAHTMTDDGSLVLYNCGTGHRCAIPQGSVDAVKPYLSQEGTVGPLNHLGQYLFRKGYLVDAHIDELGRWEFRYGQQQYRSDALQLCLLSTRQCNFRCGYCSQTFKDGSMLPEVREGVRNLVRSCGKRLTHLQITWFGGEPLLGFDVVEELGPFFRDIAAERQLTYHSDMTTNGFLLTPERAAKLLEWGVTDYQVTLDGSPQTHNMSRPLRRGGPTFDRILDNLTAMRAMDHEFAVVIRINFDQSNVQHVDELFEILRQRFVADSRFTLRFNPVRKFGGPNDDTLSVCSSSEVVTFDHDLIQRCQLFGLSPEKHPRHWLDPEDEVCYASRPFHFIIGVDGKVMKCATHLNVPENIIGQLTPDGQLNLNEDLFAQWVRPYFHSDPVCKQCFLLPACQGVQCPLKRVTDNRRECSDYKKHFSQLLKYAKEDGLSKNKFTQVAINVPRNREPAQPAS